jgi:hypothetical protein
MLKMDPGLVHPGLATGVLLPLAPALEPFLCHGRCIHAGALGSLSVCTEASSRRGRLDRLQEDDREDHHERQM